MQAEEGETIVKGRITRLLPQPDKILFHTEGDDDAYSQDLASYNFLNTTSENANIQRILLTAAEHGWIIHCCTKEGGEVTGLSVDFAYKEEKMFNAH
eukprot:CAMPEP_0174260736 /NCGR_PEP_ID=MMETSP0439-20130205/10409_1 /TAXON_ID=0 /ORGANISM="Stereomyxa ramosa, Strain Chinc5" /LENGTH=96 /DNA_ID=CAMNT_0015345049 /DNA_START=27 /DNA_END=317 /DNA_ORIENTATION=-